MCSWRCTLSITLHAVLRSTSTIASPIVLNPTPPLAAGLAIYYQLSFGWVGLAVPGILWFIGCCALMFVPQVRQCVIPWL
jgi:hypothetical protein